MSRRFLLVVAQVRVTKPIKYTSDDMLDRITDDVNREIHRWTEELQTRLATINPDLRVDVRL